VGGKRGAEVLLGHDADCGRWNGGNDLKLERE
jgi:hypothetical protein